MSGTQCTQPHCILCTGQYIVGFFHCLKARYLRVFAAQLGYWSERNGGQRPKEHGRESVLVTRKAQTKYIWSGLWNATPATDKKVHEVRFVDFDESKSKAETASAKSQAQGDEKEEFREQGELMDDESETGESVEDQKVGWDVVESDEERLQDDAVSVDTRKGATDEGLTDQDALGVQEEELQAVVLKKADSQNAELESLYQNG
jgi:hypothetical protein